ncbi:MAG: trypsin-like peptidase domain-containing protein [bacterium]|nr:trypsin-like peptidase domain-containing protein [bacterium]
MSKEQRIFFFVTLIVALVVGGLSGIIAAVYVTTSVGFEPTFVATVFGRTAKTNQFPAPLSEDELVTRLVKKVQPSVVSISISKNIQSFSNRTGPNIFPFDDFFEQFGFPSQIPQQQPQQSEPQNPSAGGQKQVVGGGTGFIITADGMILTNKHVVSDVEAEYTVTTNDGKSYPAKILAQDPVNDFAVLKIDAKGLSAVTFGDSDSIAIGQTVVAIGNSLAQFPNTVTKGVISGLGRRVTAGDNRGMSEVIEGAIQTDAAINPGNSGGPLVNLHGEVIGINTAVSQAGQLIGFAIPINEAKRAVASVKKAGKIVRPWLGVRYVLVTKELADKNQLTVDYGALVLRGQTQTDFAVIPGSPADKAGLVENDIILEIDGTKIDKDHALSRIVARKNPGDTVTLKVISKGKEKTVKVKLGEFK